MNKEEIDVLWHYAQETAAIAWVHTARYEFANLILEAAAKASESTTGNIAEPIVNMFGCDCAEAIRSMKT